MKINNGTSKIQNQNNNVNQNATLLYECIYMRVALKLVPPFLLGWSTTTDTNGGGMTVEVEPSHQYLITFCCHVTDGSRGAA